MKFTFNHLIYPRMKFQECPPEQILSTDREKIFEVPMIMTTFRITTALLLLFALAYTSSAQTSPGSIQASWDKSTKAKQAEMKPAPTVQRTAKKSDQAYTSWEKQRVSESQPWPYLPKTPTSQQIFSANTMVLDSLQNLYCLSTNYLRSLRARNDAAYRASQPEQKKDFHYTPPAQQSVRNETVIKESLSALHKELMQLLNNCIYGR